MSQERRTQGIGIAAAALLLVPAFGQTTTNTSNSGSTTTSTTTSGSSAPSNTGTVNSTSSNTPMRMPDPIRVAGRVLLEDGSPPPSSVNIQRVCNGSAHTEGYTDGSGYFSVNLGPNADVIPDASENAGRINPAGGTSGSLGSGGGGLGVGSTGGFGLNNRFGNCDLRASLGGYTSQTISLANRGPLDDPNVGTILIHKLGPEEATTVTATTLKAPKAAQKALQKGLDLEKKSKPELAMASLREAVAAYPEFAFAWCELGKLQAQSGQAADARQSFAAASKAEPRWPEPYLRLSLIAADARNWNELAALSDRVLRLNSYEYPEAFFFNAAANYNLGHLNVAEKSALSAEKLDREHRFPQIAYLQGNILAARHRYPEAAEKLRSYLALSPQAEDAPAARKLLETIEKLTAELARQQGR